MAAKAQQNELKKENKNKRDIKVFEKKILAETKKDEIGKSLNNLPSKHVEDENELS
jgi:hypothetical protein